MLDEIIQIDHTDAFNYANRCAREKGIFISISSGASLAEVQRKLNDIPLGREPGVNFLL